MTFTLNMTNDEELKIVRGVKVMTGESTETADPSSWGSLILDQQLGNLYMGLTEVLCMYVTVLQLDLLMGFLAVESESIPGT